MANVYALYVGSFTADDIALFIETAENDILLQYI